MIDLAPDFQRKAGIWSDEQQSRLIESLLQHIPIPSLYPSEPTDSSWAQESSWAIVDGVQRLTALARFTTPEALAEAGRIPGRSGCAARSTSRTTSRARATRI
ncbi:DUF262 domain-containing protein [Streptomyces sp. NPDC049954]|uniref:DUF262 domain-containing protein n=1 Tax=Streptomyces sp. NPDC049954 TaxID=3155779 RepID=UPI00341E2BC2